MVFFGVSEILFAILCFISYPFVFSFLSNKQDVNEHHPWDYPFFGMLPGLLFNTYRIHDLGTAILQRYHLTFLLKGPRFANMDMLITSDPENVRYVLSSNFSNYPKGSEYKAHFEILGDGIFNADYELWKSQRKAAQWWMKHNRFNQFLSRTSLSMLSDRLIPVLDHFSGNGATVDVQDLFQRFTFDSICVLVNGVNPGCLAVDFPEMEFAKAIDDAEEVVFYRRIRPRSFVKFQRWMNMGKEKKYAKAWRILDDTISEFIRKKRRELSRRETVVSEDNEKEEGMDLISLYITEEKELGIEANDQFLRDTFLNYWLAGRDTTSAALTWFFWLLSKNPHVETNILQELKTKTATKQDENSCNKRRIFEIKEVNNLIYLHGALCETLRLYPSVPFQLKVPLEPDTLPTGHKVTPKMKILLLFYSMGRMESIWGKDSLEFRPERWITEGGGIKHEPSYKFVAFNSGPRVCLGKELALSQMKALVATILCNYHVCLEEGQSAAVKNSCILDMKHGLKVKIFNRCEM